jgi:hypothetical protein
MIDLSLGGLLGAIIGTVLAALAYVPVIDWIERRMRAREAERSPQERASLSHELPLLRRAVLAADIILFAGAGYWLGAQLGG